MNILMVAEFIAKARIQKTAMAAYFWTTLLALEWKLPSAMAEDTFCQIALLILICAFLGNVAEHYVKSRYALPGSAAAPAPKA